LLIPWLSLSLISLQVENAITRAKKEATVAALKENLSKSALAINVKYQGLTVKEIQDFKRKLPADAKMVVSKNSLLKIAANEVEGWGALGETAKGDSAWFFVEENIADSVKAYLAFVDKLEKDGKKGAFTVQGAVMDGKLIAPAEFKKLKDLPTKKELIAKIAIAINAVPTKLAVSINAVPRKVALAVKRVSELEDDKTKTVASVAK
jgi:large subunit ribosomal protein L10